MSYHLLNTNNWRLLDKIFNVYLTRVRQVSSFTLVDSKILDFSCRIERHDRWIYGNTLTKSLTTRRGPSTRFRVASRNTSVNTSMRWTLYRAACSTAATSTAAWTDLRWNVAQRQWATRSWAIAFRLLTGRKWRNLEYRKIVEDSFRKHRAILLTRCALTSVVFLPNSKYVANTSSYFACPKESSISLRVYPKLARASEMKTHGGIVTSIRVNSSRVTFVTSRLA
jgi:hypothetical protein